MNSTRSRAKETKVKKAAAMTMGQEKPRDPMPWSIKSIQKSAIPTTIRAPGTRTYQKITSWLIGKTMNEEVNGGEQLSKVWQYTKV